MLPVNFIFEKEITRARKMGLSKVALTADIIGGRHPEDKSKSGGKETIEFVYDMDNPTNDIPELRHCIYINMAKNDKPLFGCTMTHEERKALIQSEEI